ncbi:MAG: glycosyl hydrolase family 28-related protein, partial [Verrucomicrobiota bacterium]|nr:glycosyl hydrolase family 28-related protein [Verrucomicrobiota bacterium]
MRVHTHNVCEFGAVPGDGKDDSAAVQRAIDAAVEAGGGIVYAPAGRYTFRKRLTVRPGITLRGEWKNPEQTDAFEGITVFEIFMGKNDPEGAPFIKMLFAACVRNLTFFYPDQDPKSMTPYAYTLDSVFNAVVRNATFINSWQAVGHGAMTGSGGNLETQHLYGTPLKTGLFINSGYDFNTASLIRFNPSYWIRFSALDPARKTALKKHLHEAADGVVCTYQDGMMMSKIEVDGYRYGLHFKKYTSTAGVPRTASYGQIYELALTNCR